LLQYGAEQAGLSSIITTKVLDIGSLEPLPECDIMVIADVLYNERLALLVIQRILEARQNTPAIPVLISDSQRFVSALPVSSIALRSITSHAHLL
jgi:predicted nicotinamide N-methyase